MKRSGRALLFFSSYLPCWIICAISQGLVLNAVSIIGISLAIISVITLYYFKITYQVMTQDNKASINIKKISNGSSEVMSYLITSIISTSGLQTLSSFFEGEYGLDIIIGFIFGLTIFLIYMNSNLVVVNPVLILFGFRLYLIDYSVPNNMDIKIDGILITRGAFELEKIPSDLSELLFQRIDESVFLLSGGLT